MSKKDIDFDEELERLSRKTNINIKRTEFAFEKQINAEPETDVLVHPDEGHGKTLVAVEDKAQETADDKNKPAEDKGRPEYPSNLGIFRKSVYENKDRDDRQRVPQHGRDRYAGLHDPLFKPEDIDADHVEQIYPVV